MLTNPSQSLKIAGVVDTPDPAAAFSSVFSDVQPRSDVTYTGSSASSAAITAIAALLMACAVAMGAVMFRWRDEKVIKGTSPLFNLITLAGTYTAYILMSGVFLLTVITPAF